MPKSEKAGNTRADFPDGDPYTPGPRVCPSYKQRTWEQMFSVPANTAVCKRGMRKAGKQRSRQRREDARSLMMMRMMRGQRKRKKQGYC